MARKDTQTATKQPRLPLLGVAGALLLALPSAGLAVVSFSGGEAGVRASAFDVFTPASVDPELAARVAQKARERGIRFTPVGVNTGDSERTVTVAVRVDDETARAISVRPPSEGSPGLGKGIAGLQTSRFNLGTARGYQSFARTPAPAAPVSGRQPALRETLSDLQMPDLADFAPSQPTREDRPSRLQPRIELGDEAIAGRSPNTLDAIGSQTVDVGGSFRLSRNLDVTAGVRLSQERDRLAPLTNSVQDSQAVYVGTQIKF